MNSWDSLAGSVISLWKHPLKKEVGQLRDTKDWSRKE